MADIYDKVIELARRRGFVWPSSECYGSVAGFIDYGPLGAMMKRKIENVWRDFYVVREGYFEIECPTVGEESIYIASGHVKGFADKMIQCPHCNEYQRADHIAEAHGISNAETKTLEELTEILKDLPCPACGENFNGSEVYYFNLMFQTNIGPGSQRTGYMRPETAQGIFTDFNRLLRFYRDKLPFGAVQIGKSYRNEISPRQGMIRLREFTQAEAEIFIHPEKKDHPNFARYSDRAVPLRGIKQQEEETEAVLVTMREAVDSGMVANEYVAYYIALTHDFLLTCGADPEKVRFRQHLPDERAHYATDCWDAEIFSGRFGWVEAVGIADRTDYDLRAHSKESGDKFTVFVPYSEPKKVWQKRIVPDMGALGPKFRGQAKAIADALESSSPGENGAEITVNGEKMLIPPELYEVREQEVEVRGEEVMPHVIEPSYGIDRIIYSILEHTYDEEEVEGEIRRVLHMPPRVAPLQVSVLPLMTRDGLDTLALEITDILQSEGILAQYDDAGAIGRRYRRQDEIGTPFAVTVDYDTKEDNTVTLRDRDSMKQIRCDKEMLPEILGSLIKGKKSFEEI
ncbi:glycine--tRNA ligase [Methanoplanus sp. FWC-SCC4]|uniref:glycine--tRNA ligase n=1 Tax=Methanochimaera problematica TaxID=2609417 RepID=A0AA97FCR5_9EURY|nr:glycine--tRNA ligase [Methanoplanus sp. FWC-SCC4]WOF16482.1 glycine--tRNA ligase [Methanoplanus sp. FWC-SCC4]